jgi:hypothetical protein
MDAAPSAGSSSGRLGVAIARPLSSTPIRSYRSTSTTWRILRATTTRGSPVVDEHVELLPKNDGKRYLAVFGATHLDKDHTQGFAELLDRVTIGDLWFTPRVLWEQEQDEFCDDAKAFRDEAERRITGSSPTARSAPATGSASSGSLMI